MANKSTQKEVLKRLHNIQGHISGIERMVGESSPCKDVLLQLLAVRSSIEKVGIFILENNLSECLIADTIPPEEKQKVDELVKSIVSFLK